MIAPAAIVQGRALGAHTAQREMTRAHTDEAGREWPAGTLYCPLYAGVDNTRGRIDVQVVTIAGRSVTFVRDGGRHV